MREEIYWHFRANKYNYRIGLIIFLFIASIWALFAAINQRKSSQLQLVQTWPSVEAQIIESKISALDTSSEIRVSSMYHLSLVVSYRSMETGQTIETRVLGHWPSSQNIGGNEQFKVGKKIILRVNPTNPEHMSLIDITGTI